jgi:nitrite reductase/ring-hydroxylating ferredoxin subunit
MNSNMNNEFLSVCSLSDLSEGKGKRFIVDDNEIALFFIKGEIFALSNLCPHQHTANIYDGFIEDGCVVCPAHGWMFNLRTGKTPAGGRGLISYESKVMNGKVYIKIREKDLKW